MFVCCGLSSVLWMGFWFEDKYNNPGSIHILFRQCLRARALELKCFLIPLLSCATLAVSSVWVCVGLVYANYQPTLQYQLVPYNLTHFWYCLPGDSIRSLWLEAQSLTAGPPRKLKAQSCKQLCCPSAPTATSDTNCKSRLSPVLLTNCQLEVQRGFPGGSDSKESACNEGGPGSIPGSGRSLREGNGSPLQYSCLESSMDRGTWQSTGSQSQTRLSN